MEFPYTRNRILRQSSAMRDLVAENRIHTDDFIVPLFVIEGENKREEIPSMPGYFRMSLDLLEAEVMDLWSLGLKSVLLFVKVPDELKDNRGTEALNEDGLMQRSIRVIRQAVPDMLVMTDVALDPYSSFGHDGIVIEGEIVNDATASVLGEMAASHARAGAQVVAPSDMMDGRIAMIRESLEAEQYHQTGIMAYSAKYASTLYGPFRDALDSAPGFGDKKTYQMNPANGREAEREALMDVNEGADIIMVKPATFYLDIIRRLRTQISHPISAYQVSGEYAMIKAAAAKGWLDETQVMMESLLSIKRAGADLIATYFAKDVAKLLRK
ncbi:MAG: porphobilinogen synthase [Cryomorphaceae bacterium]|nr:porphobilinogen synthase [Cryomorphaceae bacterium]